MLLHDGGEDRRGEFEIVFRETAQYSSRLLDQVGDFI